MLTKGRGQLWPGMQLADLPHAAACISNASARRFHLAYSPGLLHPAHPPTLTISFCLPACLPTSPLPPVSPLHYTATPFILQYPS